MGFRGQFDVDEFRRRSRQKFPLASYPIAVCVRSPMVPFRRITPAPNQYISYFCLPPNSAVCSILYKLRTSLPPVTPCVTCFHDAPPTQFCAPPPSPETGAGCFGGGGDQSPAAVAEKPDEGGREERRGGSQEGAAHTDAARGILRTVRSICFAVVSGSTAVLVCHSGCVLLGSMPACHRIRRHGRVFSCRLSFCAAVSAAIAGLPTECRPTKFQQQPNTYAGAACARGNRRVAGGADAPPPAGLLDEFYVSEDDAAVLLRYCRAPDIRMYEDVMTARWHWPQGGSGANFESS